jgi:condensation domain-containing protein
MNVGGAINGAGRTETWEFSPAQKRLWFLQRLSPEDPSYSMGYLIKMRIGMCIPPMRQALQQVCSRQKILASRIEEGESGPRQSYREGESPPLGMVDLSGLEWNAREEEIRGLISQFSARSFRFGKEDLIRVKALKAAGRATELLFSLHHIICDAEAAEVLFQDLCRSYGSVIQATPPSIPPLPFTFADHAKAQNLCLEEPMRARLLGHWKGVLHGFIFPARSHGSGKKYAPGKGRVKTFPISSASLVRMASFCARNRVTPFISLVTAFHTAWSHYTGKLDVLFATVASQRIEPGAEEIIGCFGNEVYIRINSTGIGEFSDLLLSVRSVFMDALRNMELPSDILVKELGWTKESGGYSPVDVMVVNQNPQRWTTEGAAEGLEVVALSNGGCKYDFLLSISQVDGFYSCMIEYNPIVHPPLRVDRLQSHFIEIVSRMLLGGGFALDKVGPILASIDKANDLQTSRRMKILGKGMLDGH